MRVEDRLAALDENMDAFIEDARGKFATKAEVYEVIKEISATVTKVEESSNGFIDRLREALKRE